MRYLKSLLMLATLGMSTTAYADWRLITPERIDFIDSDIDATTLWLKDGYNNSCSTQRNIAVLKDDPRHDQVFTMIMTALVAERTLEVYVLCDGGSGRFGKILLK